MRIFQCSNSYVFDNIVFIVKRFALFFGLPIHRFRTAAYSDQVSLFHIHTKPNIFCQLWVQVPPPSEDPNRKIPHHGGVSCDWDLRILRLSWAMLIHN